MTETDAQSRFWLWFIQHQAELLTFEENQEAVFDQLAFQLQQVDPDLTFEFGPPGSRREFVISAGGIKRAFPAVVALANAAPDLAGWKITAFRPRRTPLNVVEFGGKQVNPVDVQFSLLNNGTIAGIYLFLPGWSDNDTTLGQIGYLLLDDALGEYDVESRVGLIKMMSPDADTSTERHVLTELPRLFDRLALRLENRSGLPS
jgi:hypothetical protein